MLCYIILIVSIQVLYKELHKTNFTVSMCLFQALMIDWSFYKLVEDISAVV